MFMMSVKQGKFCRLVEACLSKASEITLILSMNSTYVFALQHMIYITMNLNQQKLSETFSGIFF